MRASFGQLCLAFIASSSWVGCADQFRVLHLTPDARDGRHISVFGVERDGLMNRAGWAALGPELNPPFGARHCAIAYGDPLFSERPTLAAALDRQLKADVELPALLNEVAPAANGDIILVVTVGGRASRNDSALGRPSVKATPSGGWYGRNGVGPGVTAPTDKSDGDEAGQMRMTAYFFSVAKRQLETVVHMKYDGTHMDQGLRTFLDRLETEFPRSACAGWDWSKRTALATSD